MTRTTLCLLAATLSLTATAQATAPGAAPARAWNVQTLASAKYVILAPQIQGNPNVLNAEQRAGILAAMQRDSAGAIQRHYPGATIVQDPQTPDAVRVTPVLVTPPALLPWAKLTARLHFDLGGGQNVVLDDQFGLLVLWQHQADAANYLYDQLVRQLP